MSTVSLEDNGNIKIEVGEPYDIITQLGKNPDVFKPYSIKTRYSGVDIFYCYAIKKEYLPASFESTDDFVETLKIQSPTNEYVQNYAEIGGEYLNEYLKEVGIIDDNVYFIKVPSQLGDLNTTFFNSFIGLSNKFVSDGALTLKDEYTVEDLRISKTAPKEAKEYFRNIFKNLNKVDSFFTFEELKIDPKFYIYLNGFVSVNWNEFSKIPENAQVILVKDRLKNGHVLYDVVEQLSERFNVINISTLFRQF